MWCISSLNHHCWWMRTWKILVHLNQPGLVSRGWLGFPAWTAYKQNKLRATEVLNFNLVSTVASYMYGCWWMWISFKSKAYIDLSVCVLVQVLTLCSWALLHTWHSWLQRTPPPPTLFVPHTAPTSLYGHAYICISFVVDRESTEASIITSILFTCTLARLHWRIHIIMSSVVIHVYYYI